MKPFKLQVVLDHRQRLEDMAQQKLSQARMVEEALSTEHASAQQQLEELRDEYEQRQAKGMLSHEFMLYENRIEHQRNHIMQLEWARKKAQDFVLECREELGAASQNKHLLAKLKEKRLAEQEQELKHKEMNELDEMTILRQFEEDL
ncbi:MAG: flagellar FliJ family protein [Desulfuromonadaceae bacterium]|jgi:flagellar FliJ protein|nr:flagellar FliJ family protein [Desulfuromonas sp.]MDY0184991.1 flagellar FliJ family protein [Desulfuromonadaceae bacterium]